VIKQGPRKVMSEKMKEQYALALERDTTKEELIQKLKSNTKNVLLKYMKKLEMSPIPSESTSEPEILAQICEFLVTKEGKLRAAYNLSEATY